MKPSTSTGARCHRVRAPLVRALGAAIPGLPGAIPHQALGPLSAAQWLRFARLQAEHHLAIAMLFGQVEVELLQRFDLGGLDRL